MRTMKRGFGGGGDRRFPVEDRGHRSRGLGAEKGVVGGAGGPVRETTFPDRA
jgi:hypothetical protein